MKYVLVAIIFLTIGFFLGSITPKFRNMRSEYETSRVIQKVSDYVTTSKGSWPRTWKDIGLNNEDNLTIINFELDISKSDKFEIMESINCRSGKWYTYPYYHNDMEALWNTVRLYRTPSL